MAVGDGQTKVRNRRILFIDTRLKLSYYGRDFTKVSRFCNGNEFIAAHASYDTVGAESLVNDLSGALDQKIAFVGRMLMPP